MPFSKQQLEVVNQTNFPDNNANYITPALLRDFNTDMIDAIQLTGSYAVTSGSNTFQGNQTIIGDLTVTGTLTVPVIHTIYETASVIYSSGSNQFGDELTDTQTLSGSVKVQGSLTVNGTPVLTSSAQVTGFVTTSSFNAYTSSNNQRVSSLEVNSASVNTSITNLNTFTASQSTLNGTFATTGSNTFTGNQIIDKTKALYTNALYWTSSEVGYTNLEIINQGGGNLDFASLNGGKMRIVNTPLLLTGSALSSSNDISTSANIYAANLTASVINTGSFVTTSSFNSYTSSQDLLNATFATIGGNQTFTGANAFQQALSVQNGLGINGQTTFGDGQILNTFFLQNISGSLVFNKIATASKVDLQNLSLLVSGTFTSSLQQGYVWVGDGNGRTTTVATSSFIDTFNSSSLVTTASFNAYTQSNDQRVSSLETNSASVNISITNINTATASLFTSASLSLTTASLSGQTLTFTKGNGSTFGIILPDVSGSDITALNAFTASQLTINTGYNTFTQSAQQSINSLNASSASQQVSIDALNTNSASVNISISNLNSFSQSAQISINSLNGATSSYANSASVALVDANQQSQINSLIAATGSYLTSSADITALNSFTASQLLINTGYNTFTSSANQRLSSLETTSASVNISVSALNTFTASQSTASIVTSINNLNTFSASALVSINELNQNSASVNTSISNINQFTQSAQISINSINAVSSSWITESETASFARTNVDNNFTANQTFTNITATSASITYLTTLYETASVIYSSGSNQLGDELTDVQTLSGSVKVQGSLTINGTPVLTSSVDISGLVTTASFNAYTQSNDQKVTALETNSASVNTSITNINSTTASLNTSVTNLNQFTASQSTASLVTSITNLNTFSASALVSISNLNSTTASLNTSVSNLNTFSASTQTSINALNTFTASQSTASLVTSIDNLNTFSASALVSISNINSTTQSLNTSVSNLNSATSSLFASASLALITASFDNGTRNLTFTKGDTTQFSVNIPDVSGSTNFVTTSSFNQYTQSNDQRVSSLETNSASVNISISNINSTTASLNTSVTNLNASSASQQVSIDALNQFTASQSTASIVNSITELNTFSASALVSISNLNASSASQQISIDNLNTNSASVNTSITNINSATASLFDSASLALTTASFDNGTRNLTFTKGNNQTFSVNIPDVSGSTINTGSFATTASFNSYTQSNDQRVTSLEVNSASVNTSIANINTTTASLNTSVTNINSATASLFTSASLALVTASVSLNTITFTKGDGTTFPITVNTGSGGGGTTDTGSLMVTGSVTVNVLTFTKGDGSTFDLTVSASGSAPEGTVSSSAQILAYNIFATTGSNTFTGNQLINKNGGEFQVTDPSNPQYGTTAIGISGASGGLIFKQSGSVLIEGSAGNKNLTFYGTGSFVKGIALSDNDFIAGATIRYDTTNDVIIIEKDGAYKPSLNIEGGLTASLENGYAWVGNASGRTVAVATSSFGGGGGGNFATTGSNTFTGDQTLIDNAGNFFTISDASGSMMLVAKGFTSASAHMSASAAGIGNFIFKTNSNTADTIISGSNNIFTNQTAPTAGFKRYIGGSNNIINSTSGPQISGSMGFSPGLNANYYVGTMNMRGPVSSSTWNISNNIIQGTANIGSNATNNAEKAVAGLTMTGNSVNGTLAFVANRSLHTQGNTINNNIIVGTTTLTAASSSIIYSNNIGGAISVTNNASGSGAAVTNSANATYVANNLFLGSSNTITATGSSDPGDTNANAFVRESNFNQILGYLNGVNLPYVATGSNALNATMIAGIGLGVTGSNASFFSTGFQYGGSAFFGRYNAQDGNRAQSAQTVFAVGTGTSTTRKTGFLIDSGSNSYFEGTLNVSGSTTLQGNTTFIDRSGTSNGNIYLGSSALTSNTTGISNVAIGQSALQNNTTGNNNFGLGVNTLQSNATGNGNFAAGVDAGRYSSGSSNVFIGGQSGQYVTGSANIIIGAYTGTAGEVLESNIILADGVGNVKAQYSGSAWSMKAPVNFTTGSNQQAGTAVLDGANPGTVTVSNSLVTANSIILLTKQTLNHTNGYVAVSAKSAGSFTITSNHNGDADTVGWFIINNS